jgi:tetratricopeptide (TPR) repeat protein
MIHHHYAQQEKDDAEKVDKAVAWIRGGNIRDGQAALEEVTLNTPEFYVYNFGDDKTQYIKFWTMAEYLGYIAMTRTRGEVVEQEVMWLRSAYPRALYELAMLDLGNDNCAGAAEYLDRALMLEPDHPECLLKMAEIYALSGDAENALEHFDSVLGSRPYMSSKTMSLALGNKARVLIDLDQLEEAQQCLEESLRHGPGNQLAENLQRYIESVKENKVTAPVEMESITPMPPPPDMTTDTILKESQDVPDKPESSDQPPEKKRWWQVGRKR